MITPWRSTGENFEENIYKVSVILISRDIFGEIRITIINGWCNEAINNVNIIHKHLKTWDQHFHLERVSNVLEQWRTLKFRGLYWRSFMFMMTEVWGRQFWSNCSSIWGVLLASFHLHHQTSTPWELVSGISKKFQYRNDIQLHLFSVDFNEAAKNETSFLKFKLWV